MRKIALLSVLIPLTAWAIDPLAFTLMPPHSQIDPLKPVHAELLAVNPGNTTTAFVPPAALLGQLSYNGRSLPIEARLAKPGAQSVPPRGYAAWTYEFSLPPGIAGKIMLEFSLPENGRVSAIVDAATAGAPDVPATQAETPLGKVAANAPTMSVLQRAFVGRFGANDSVYFIYGGGDQAAKFQLSFDYRLADWSWGQAGKEKTTALQLGYTQRSLWDIDNTSSPFYDTSYMPEVVLDTLVPLSRASPGGFNLLGVRTGLKHESNGRDGLDSRSMNIFYVRPTFLFGPLDSWHVIVAPEVFAYLSESSDNDDIDEYRGYGRLRVAVGKSGRPALMLTAWSGKDFDHFTYQLDFTVPLRSRWLNIESFFLVQYFNGYGESILSYREKSDALRAGFSILR